MRFDGARGVDVTQNHTAEDRAPGICVARQQGDPNRRVCVIVHDGYRKAEQIITQRGLSLQSIPRRNRTCQKGREVMIFVLCLNSLALISLLQETTGAFDDLGTLLLGGVAAAIVVAVAFTLIRFRLRDKKPQTSNFISISSDKE